MNRHALNRRIGKLEASVPKKPEKVKIISNGEAVPKDFDGTVIVLNAVPVPQRMLDHRCG